MPSSTRGRPARASTRFRVRPLLGALAAAGVIAPTSLHAATIPVTAGGDADVGTCTLRAAATSLNLQVLQGTCTNPSAVPFGTNDTIDLTAQSNTITLAGAAVPILVSTVISGPGATQLTISGGGNSRVIEATAPSIVVDIRNVTIANGRTLGPGGCIYGTLVDFEIFESVVTGCRADHDPMGPPFLNGLGGGIFGYAVALQNSTVSGNTAQTAGGGVLANYLFADKSLVSGNTVTGHTCDVGNTPTKYCVTALFGGGGLVGASGATLVESVVSGNTVNASTFTDGGIAEYRFGTGGGITQFSKYQDGGTDTLLAGKSTVTGARALFRGANASTAATAKARFKERLAALPVQKGKKRSKADGQGEYRLGLFATTVSGNRIVGGGGGVTFVAKYGGGGAAFLSEYENAEIVNSTISGNSLPNGFCAYTGPQGSVLSCGAGLVGDSFELTNSTVTGNNGFSAVQSKYGSRPSVATAGAKSAKVAKALQGRPVLAGWHARWQQKVQATPGLRSKAVAKAASEPILDSTIVAGNNGTYDIACIIECTISGSNNLVRTAQLTVTLPGDTISANPQLAPLGNNGGVVAGAPGVTGTGPVRTHALYVGSQAIDAGSNIEGFLYDQRGPGFPRQVGGNVDIGAFEGAVIPPAGTPVPALSAAQLALLAAMLAGSAAFLRRRRRA